MGRVSSTAASTLGTGATIPDIQNVAVTAATEETITFPAGTRRYRIQLRDLDGFQVRTAAAATEYYTVPCGNDYQELDLAATTTYTLYITPDSDGTLEIFSWL